MAALAEIASASTLKVRRAAIGAAHRAASLEDPAGSELVRRALAGLVRERAAPQRQARALGLAELAAIKATSTRPRTGRQSGRSESRENARRRGLADIALCSVLFFAGLWRSEAAALIWGDVEAFSDGSGLLWVRRSKTDRDARLEAEAKAKTEAEAAQAEKRRKGFHCLSAWDGSHRDVVKQVKERLRDPDSFDHMDTWIGPVDDDGEHSPTMKYRARNGFGGMNIETARAIVRNEDCEALLIEAGTSF